MSESHFNYTVIEKMHKSPIWDNHILKVRVRGKDKIYVLKLYGGINEPFQKLVFNREMEALKVLNSCSNIVKIRDTTASLKYNGKSNYGAILMDYVDGKTLDLYDWHSFTQLKKYEICLKILQAVYNAHANDVIHRDLKPQNIIYDDVNDEITIIDFGSSKIKTIIEKETTMPMFSENYSAPEVVKGNDITEKCDYYSLGVIFSELFLCKEAESNVEMICLIEKSSMDEVLKSTLCSMLQDNPSDRPESIDEITDVFTQLIGELNTSSNDYSVFIDFEKMRYLKRSMVIENSMNMTQFTNSFLKREFLEGYGYYDEHHEKYIITGKTIVVECSYDEKVESFEVMRISEVATDRRNINIRRSFKIEGKLSFYDSRFRYTCHNGKDNKKLWIMFKNRREDNERYREREEKFDKLFGSWQEGLEESIISEKDKVAKIVYSESHIDNGQIVLEVDECQNKSIDELEQNTKFIIEGVDDRGQPVYFELGILDDIICDDDSVKIVIQMPKKVLKGNVRTLLKKKGNVMEDFRANTSSYKRQMSAIRSLKSEEYSARNLKDILLNVEEPEEIPTIFEPKFIAQKLNPSQQQAVIKALNSENIGLIQGPPGTGKTKVIKEIIGQVVTKSIKTADSPRILIVSQSHTAVDNILEGLDSTISDDLEIVRIGADKNVSPKISCRYTMPAHRDKLFSDVKKNVEKYDKRMEEVYQDISDQRILDRWKKIKEIQEDWIDRSVEKDCLDYQLVRSATVIAGTCVGFLANSFVKDMEFDYVIIDEAAKATTPELLVSIIKAKKIILVGDQNQLPAYADQRISPRIAKLTKNPEYRMFDILFETLPDSHKQVLSTQYRMIRNIGNLISTVFYGGTIDTGCKDEDKLHGLSRYEGYSIIWFDTSENRRRKQKKTKGNSFMNEEEKRIILDILEDLKKSNELDNQDIGIITGYSGQKDILRNSVKAIGYDKIAQIDINVLDAFQGRENDIIMYSTVRTDNSIGFQKEKERVNVAFSRAKKLLIICGDLNFFYNYNDPNNKFIEIIDYIKTHDHCKIISCKGGKSILKKLMEDLFQHIIPVNEGYDYLFSDLVYVPIYETSLLVTKRTIMPISLVEEKVLQLIDVGVYQIDEIAQILGLKRKLLDVTLADLYSKNLVMVSTNSCKMMTAGREALNNLNRTEKKQDILKNVCLDGILGNIIDSAAYELQNNVRDNDGKLKPIIPTGEVKYYIEQFKRISQIFDEENVLYFSEGVQPVKEELLKIDKIDSTFVKYIKIPIHIYVSSNGLDIDIVQASNKYKELLELYKDYIIEQINNKKVLKNHFKYRRINQQGYEGELLEEKSGLYDELKKIHFTKNKKSIDYTLITDEVFNDRKLMDGEYRDILKYIVSQSSDVDLYVDNFDDWAFDSQFTATLTENMGKSNLSIYYAQANNIKAAKKQIEWNFKGGCKCVEKDKKYFFCWKTESYLLYGVPKLRNVIDDNTTCLCMSYYLRSNS